MEENYRLATPRVPHDEKHNAEAKERLRAIREISTVREPEEQPETTSVSSFPDQSSH